MRRHLIVIKSEIDTKDFFLRLALLDMLSLSPTCWLETCSVSTESDATIPKRYLITTEYDRSKSIHLIAGFDAFYCYLFFNYYSGFWKLSNSTFPIFRICLPTELELVYLDCFQGSKPELNTYRKLGTSVID